MALLKVNQRKHLIILLKNCQKRCFAKFVSDFEVKKCYTVLGLTEDSDQVKIRNAYLGLVRKFHPDSGEPEADSNKFTEIDNAFRTLLTKKSKDRWSADEVNFEINAQIFDIKHTAPQHRQYLNFNGVGVGTPYQREKQFSKVRAMNLVESVLTHRINKAQANELSIMEKKSQKNNASTKYGFDRLVEDLIQDAMIKGEFDNLSGKGKPLRGIQNINPYVDFVTQKLNQVLMDNGFTPEWIMLQKEIREDKFIVLNVLRINRSKLGKYPFEYHDVYRWEKVVDGCEIMSNEINKKIQKYNLVVPVLQTQMCLFNYRKEAEKIAKYGEFKIDKPFFQTYTSEVTDDSKNILSLLLQFLIKVYYAKK